MDPSSLPLISRKRAVKEGLPRYFTGIPCVEGHVVERYTVQATCVECVRHYNAVYVKQLPERAVEAKRAELLAAGDLGAWAEWELKLAAEKEHELWLEKKREANRAMKEMIEHQAKWGRLQVR